MGRWGAEVFQNDTSLDYISDFDNLMTKMWLEIGICVDAKQMCNGDWYFSKVYLKNEDEVSIEIAEDMLLAWIDIVTKTNILSITEEQQYGASTFLKRRIKDVKDTMTQEWEKERLKVLVRMRNKIRKYERVFEPFLVKHNYREGKCEFIGLGIKKENEEIRKVREYKVKESTTPPIKIQVFFEDMEEDEWFEFLEDMDNSYDEEKVLGLLEQQQEQDNYNSHDKPTRESRFGYGRHRETNNMN